MKHLRSISSAVALGLLWLGLAAPAQAQLYTESGASTPAGASGDKSAVAFDDKHQVYLQVYQVQTPSAYDVWARFIGANGGAIGSPFVISTNRFVNGLFPRVAYSRGSGVDEFFVTYLADQTIPGLGRIFAQRVQYTGAGPTGGTILGSPIPVSPFGTQAAASNYDWFSDVVFNPRTSRFMVAWDQVSAPGPSVMTRQFNADGSAAGNAVNASPKTVPGAQGAPALAYDWNRNVYCVVYTGDHPNAPNTLGAFSYLLDGNTGALASNLITLSIGYTIEPTVAYLPEADGFLASWSLYTNTVTSNARYIPSTATSGALPNPEYVAMASGQQVGAPSLAYDYVSRRVLMASMRALDPNPGVIGGAILDAYGTPTTGTFTMSTVPSALPGTLNPRVTAAGGGVFGLTYVSAYAAVQFERFQFPAAQTPGPSYNCVSNCNPPPPTDTDGDGIPDNLDSCPTVFAQTATGCPAVPLQINGDFTGDGKPELTWQNVNSSGQVYTWLLGSSMTYAGGGYLVADPSIPNGVGWTIVGTSDFSGDGKPDLLWQNTQSGQVILFRMDASTKLGEQQIATNVAWRIVATGDFNADGNADIVWQNFATGQVYVWFMSPSNGLAGIFNPFQGSYIKDGAFNPISLGANSPWRIVGVGDVDGDGKTDLVWQNSATGNLSAWYLLGTVYKASPPDIQFPDLTWKVRSVADYNGDGHPDFVFQNVVNGSVAAWLMNGMSFLQSVSMGTVNLTWQIVGAK